MSLEQVQVLKERIKAHQTKRRAAEAKERNGHKGAGARVEYHSEQIALLEAQLLKLTGGTRKDAK